MHIKLIFLPFDRMLSVYTGIRDPGSGAFLTPRFRDQGWVGKARSGSRMNICCESGIWNFFDSGSGIPDGKFRIRDKHLVSATLGHNCKYTLITPMLNIARSSAAFLIWTVYRLSIYLKIFKHLCCRRYGRGLAESMQTDPEHFGFDEQFWARY